jgi:glutathione synthase/RimK-type ligase-like ATP-grasp enzyme
VRRIAIATCAELPVADDDADLLARALDDLGIEGVPCVWDDPSVAWGNFEMVVLRSTWDYTAKHAAFLDWADSLDRVENPAAVVRWNTDKHYLADLASRGVPVVPTTFPADGGSFEVPDADRFVVKPTVGAGSMGAERFERHQRDEALAHMAKLQQAGRAAMVQPYLDLVDDLGETGIIVIDGEPSHAIEKAPMLVVSELDRTGLFRTESIRPRQPSAAEVRLAHQALGSAESFLGLAGPLLYARVDMLPTPDGPVVIELELTEPSLFLSHATDAAGRFAKALSKRLR